MILHCDNSHIPEAENFIGKDIPLCFYLYMDMLECGAEAENMDLWLAKDESGVQAVFYRYHTTMHMFSRGGYDETEVREFLRQHPCNVVFMTKEDADRLGDLFTDYTAELSHIITNPVYMEGRTDLDIAQAGLEDADAIAELMMTSDIYNTVYSSAAELAEQLRERLNSGFGRLFVIRKGDRVIATNATSAETDKLAVVSGLVTDPNERGQGLGRAITAHTWNLAKREGKTVLAYLACDNDNTVRLHKAMGYDFIGISARFKKD